ncbi:tripartite motif-containing protein 59-like protein [Aphelenchoides avenae]|nr:tripartite motif-containing protein 59-like protein [Aphelenchus avenae]
MAELVIAKATECSVCLDDYKDPRITACGHSFCAGCVQKLIDASPSPTAVACPECRQRSRVPSNGFPKNFRLSNVIAEMQVGVACSSCQRKAPPEDMFRCETCRADVDNDQDVALCGVCATKHSMAFKEHELVEDRMASKRDTEEAIKRIDRKQPANRTYVIAAQSEATEYYAMEANEV